MSDPRLDQLTDFTFAYTSGPKFYVGFETLTATGVGSGSGSSSVSTVRKTFITASGSGAGTSSSAYVRIVLVSATGSGVGSSSATGILLLAKAADGSGTGSSTATGHKVVFRSATGSGTGSTGAAVTTNKLFIFRPPVNDSFAWNDRLRPVSGDFLLRKLVPGTRAKNVYKLTDGSYTTNQPAEVEDYLLVHLGAHNNFVSAAEKADLVAAGYGDYVT